MSQPRLEPVPASALTNELLKPKILTDSEKWIIMIVQIHVTKWKMVMSNACIAYSMYLYTCTTKIMDLIFCALFIPVNQLITVNCFIYYNKSINIVQNLFNMYTQFFFQSTVHICNYLVVPKLFYLLFKIMLI